MYLEALQNLFTGNFQAEAITKVSNHLANWLTIGGGAYLILAGGTFSHHSNRYARQRAAGMTSSD